jgi:hypothetical protein
MFFFASVAVFAGARGHEESCTSHNPSCIDRDCKLNVILLWWMLTRDRTLFRFLSRFYLSSYHVLHEKMIRLSKMLWTKLNWESSSSQNVLVRFGLPLNLCDIHVLLCVWVFVFLSVYLPYISAVRHYIWAASRQNQHNWFATIMDPDQPAHPRSLIRIHAVRLQTI